MFRPLRFILLAAAAAALASGLWAGLERIGWVEPATGSELMLWHGPLMVSAFFATLIGLERAVALGERWLYAAPALSAASGLLLVTGTSPQAAAVLASAAAGILGAGAVEAFRREPALYMAALATGVFALLGGNILWAIDGLSPAVALWWAGFLLLIIAGERLELSRILRHGPLSHGWFGIAVATIAASLPILLANDQAGLRLLGAGLLLLTLWLVLFDIARRTVRQQGLTRYMAVALLAGYTWLAFTGALLALGGEPLSGSGYDAVLHSIFVGFAFSMVFAHAPVIFPALTSLDLPWRPIFYLPLALLHVSLAARLTSGAVESFELRAAAGATSAAAILLFFALMAGSAVTARLVSPQSAREGPTIDRA